MQHRLINSNFKESGQFQAEYTAIISSDTPFSEVENPMFWTNIAKKLRQGDIIRILAEDISYYAEAIVVSVSPQWAKIKFIREKVDLVEEKSDDLPDVYNGYEVKWRGPNGGFSVIKKPDNTVLFEKAQTKEDAQRWLDNHIKTIS